MPPKAKAINILYTAIFLIALYSLPCFAADYTIIANRGVSATSLSKNDLLAIFTGEKTRWEDGKPINIVILRTGDESRAFLQNIVGKTPTQYEIFWKKQVFTGRAAPPTSFEDPANVVRYVAKTSGAVGFVGTDALTGNIKTILIK